MPERGVSLPFTYIMNIKTFVPSFYPADVWHVYQSNHSTWLYSYLSARIRWLYLGDASVRRDCMHGGSYSSVARLRLQPLGDMNQIRTYIVLAEVRLAAGLVVLLQAAHDTTD
jgi:hypothetical protein